MRKPELKKLLYEKTGCCLQHNGWPCNSCFHAMHLGIDNDSLHTLWLAVLGYRGDYELTELGIDKLQVKQGVTQLYELLKSN